MLKQCLRGQKRADDEDYESVSPAIRLASAVLAILRSMPFVYSLVHETRDWQV